VGAAPVISERESLAVLREWNTRYMLVTPERFATMDFFCYNPFAFTSKSAIA
jgi:hypothetical protein